MSNEDALTASYKYAWSSDSELSLQDFLVKFKPSMVQNDGTKPWIWARGAEGPKESEESVAKALLETTNLLKEITEKVESIKSDETIPIRANKKTGAKSKKEVREQVQAEATEKLKAIALKHGYLSGKWLIFAPADRIDMIWSGIATSLVSGPLHTTSAFLTKVATSSENENTSAPQQHLICVYMPNVYDKDAVTEVMKILLRNHGVNLSGVKSDLYTLAGLDSKHPSGIPSTVWKNTALLPDKEIKELKEAYFAGLANTAAVIDKPLESKVANGNPVAGESNEKTVKAKPKLKKKAQKDDPFASEDDQPAGDDKVKPASSKGKKPALPKAKPKKIEDSEDDDDDGEEEAKRKAELAAKKRSTTKRAKVDDDDDDMDEDERPKKKKTAKK
ncbi:hypothetical protein CPB83DRAFT_857525 [Crepidotus variabilis]|uniref:Uncharacterized protein n=1 Tax=Crepidotus variabilis TaxID=179855 RepID=A0A9P6EBY8_9AGAR|nr:hypothetical protein CPB83DRAFT_857525 [Crepidotus variabilis]